MVLNRTQYKALCNCQTVTKTKSQLGIQLRHLQKRPFPEKKFIFPSQKTTNIVSFYKHFVLEKILKHPFFSAKTLCQF